MEPKQKATFVITSGQKKMRRCFARTNGRFIHTSNKVVSCFSHRQLSGFPLYDGRFTPAEENVNFVMTMVNCDKSGTFDINYF